MRSIEHYLPYEEAVEVPQHHEDNSEFYMPRPYKIPGHGNCSTGKMTPSEVHMLSRATERREDHSEFYTPGSQVPLNVNSVLGES